MEIKKTEQEKTVILTLAGRLDTTTAPQLEAAVKEALESADKLVLDFNDLEYISSAGLRVLLAAHKGMSQKDGLVVRNVCDDIKEVFDITGFSDILTVE